MSLCHGRVLKYGHNHQGVYLYPWECHLSEGRFGERDPQRKGPDCGGDERRQGRSGVGSGQAEMGV
jgi:hypothetical protein